MNAAFVKYQQFIDDLVELSTRSVVANNVQNWSQNEEEINALDEKFSVQMSKLTANQREQLANLLQQSYEAGIFDMLVHLTDKINLSGLKFSQDGVELATEPFGTTLFEDWVHRKEGDDWPLHQLDDRYKD